MGSSEPCRDAGDSDPPDLGPLEHKVTIALGRLLDEVAASPDVLGAEAGLRAGNDASRLEDVSYRVERFATKVVAHFDCDYASASQNVRWDDFDRAIDLITEVFERWFPQITGEGVVINLPSLPWQNVVRLSRRDLSLDNPQGLAARVVYSLGVASCAGAPGGAPAVGGGSRGLDRSAVRPRRCPLARGAFDRDRGGHR